MTKGRLEGEDDVIEKGEMDDNFEQGRYIACADRVGGAIVGVKSPPALDESGREEPRHKTGWARKVDDGNHGGNKANDINGPSVGC